jgi:hypothetical protein
MFASAYRWVSLKFVLHLNVFLLLFSHCIDRSMGEKLASVASIKDHATFGFCYFQ